MKTLFDAICWDHDGLLVDTERLFFEVTRDVFADVGVILPVDLWSTEYLSKGVGTALISRNLGLTSSQADEIVRERNRRYRETLEFSPPFRPNVMEVLKSLYGILPMALVTGSPRENIFTAHRHTGMLDFLSLVITREDYKEAKPEPDSYLEAATRLGIPPSRCLAVEDSKRGLSAAVSAGMRCVVVPNTLTSGQDFISSYAIESSVLAIPSHVLEIERG